MALDPPPVDKRCPHLLPLFLSPFPYHFSPLPSSTGYSYIKVDDYEDDDEWDDGDQEEERTDDEGKAEKIASRGPDGQGLAPSREAPKGGTTASAAAAQRTRAVTGRPPAVPATSRRPFPPSAPPPAAPRKETAGGAAARPVARGMQPSAAAGTRHGSFTIRRRRHGGKPLVEKKEEREQQQPAADRGEQQQGKIAPAAPAALEDEAVASAPAAVKASAEASAKGSGPDQLAVKVPMPRKKLTKGFEVVPMKGNAYNLEFVEKHGKQTGYMGAEGPVKVRLQPRPASATPLQILRLLHCPSPSRCCFCEATHRLQTSRYHPKQAELLFYNSCPRLHCCPSSKRAFLLRIILCCHSLLIFLVPLCRCGSTLIGP